MLSKITENDLQLPKIETFNIKFDHLYFIAKLFRGNTNEGELKII